MYFFFFNDTATTEIYTLSLHDALPIFSCTGSPSNAGWTDFQRKAAWRSALPSTATRRWRGSWPRRRLMTRSEEHTSELQSRQYLVCRLLLEKKKKNNSLTITIVLLYII